MKYERLRTKIINRSGIHEPDGASIFIRRGMFVWFKSWESFTVKRTIYTRDESQALLPSNLQSKVILLLTNMALANFQQRVCSG